MKRSVEFRAFIWMYLSHYLGNLDNGDLPTFHKEWTELIDEKRLAIAAPRSFAKSSYFSIFYPLFQILEGGAKDVLLISAASDLSVQWLGRIKRELESNQKLIEVFGDQKSGIWKQDHIEMSCGAVIRARGAECKIRGLRPDLVLIDDLESEETVWSEANRNKLSQWFKKALMNVMNPDSQLIIIGTLLHPEALLNSIVNKLDENWANWETRTYKALEEGESIWPSKWSTVDLGLRRQEIGNAAFEQEYMNNPIPEEWRTFKEESFRFFDVIPPMSAYFTTVDPAININTNSDPDYTAIVTCAVDAEKNIYVTEVTRRRMLPSETVDEIFRHISDHNPDIVGIEVMGFQKVLKFMLDEECNRRGVHPFFKEINAGGMRKRYRIERLQPFFEKGKIYLKKDMHELKSELLSFPTGKHDDMIDALASQLELIHKGGSSTKNLPEDCFDAWWMNFKSQRRSAGVIGGVWGNNKLRG